MTLRVAYSAKCRKELVEGEESISVEEQKIMYKVDKDGLVEKFVYQLPILRAVLDMSQDDVGEIVGLSRQTYSSIETRKRKMTWSLWLFCFSFTLTHLQKRLWRMPECFRMNLRMR